MKELSEKNLVAVAVRATRSLIAFPVKNAQLLYTQNVASMLLLHCTPA